MITTAYDEVLYPYSIRPATHAARLGTLSQLFGRPTTPFPRSRVMEIGGGDAVNLVSMAMAAPEAEFYSFDLSARAVEAGRDLVRRVGLANVHVEQADLCDIPAEWGRFDYIIAHGVYAWVPAPVREAMMALVGDRLTEQGVAMISYNVMPGCRNRQTLRDIMLDAAGGVADPQQRIAAGRAALEFHLERWDMDKPHLRAVAEEARDLLRRPDGVIFHDEMGEVYEPQFVSDVVAAARRHGLDYLGDTQLALAADLLWPGDFAAAAAARTGGDLVRYEQLKDFEDGRAFRQSLFCRAGAAIDTRFDAARTRGLYASGALDPIEGAAHPEGQLFRTLQSSEVETRDPRLIDIFARLTAVYPRNVPLAELTEDPELIQALANLFCMGALELTTIAFPVVSAAGERPTVGRLARVQAEGGLHVVTSQRHTPVEVRDAGARQFLMLADGSRTQDELAAEMATLLDMDIEKAHGQVHDGLRAFVRLALMEA